MARRTLFGGIVLGVAGLVLGFGGVASAHVVVSPGEAVTGRWETFTVSVPNEKQLPTTAIQVKVPDGITHVAPTVAPGWTTAGNDQAVTWTGGSIPAGQRQEFSFSAKMPDKTGELRWMAYQTYADGTVVSWDKSTDGEEGSNSGPFSVTVAVATDPASQYATKAEVRDAKRSATRAQTLGLLALAISLLSFSLVTRKKKSK